MQWERTRFVLATEKAEAAVYLSKKCYSVYQCVENTGRKEYT